jgi:hypothetical protein
MTESKPKIATKRRTAKKSTNKLVAETYSQSPQVQDKEACLKQLQDHRREIETSISEIVTDYNAKVALSADAAKFLERMPLESLKDLQEFSAGKKLDSNLGILRSKSKLRKDRNKKLQNLTEVNRQIVESQIDLLIAKIDHVISKPNT